MKAPFLQQIQEKLKTTFQNSQTWEFFIPLLPLSFAPILPQTFTHLTISPRVKPPLIKNNIQNNSGTSVGEKSLNCQKGGSKARKELQLNEPAVRIKGFYSSNPQILTREHISFSSVKTIETEKLSKKVGKKSKPKNIKRRKQYIILELEEEAQS